MENAMTTPHTSNRPLQLGMHGFGYIGRIHALSLETCKLLPQLNPHIQWKRCFVRDVNSEAYHLASQVFEEVVVDDGSPLNLRGLDAIDITTPNDLHRRVALQAASEGVHIYCEKPLAARLEDSEQMVDAVVRAGVVHQVALCSRVLPAVEQAYWILQSGVLGNVLNFRATKWHGGYLSPNRAMAWRLEKSRSGAGSLMDLGVHVIDLVLFLLGSAADVRSVMRTYVPARKDARGNTQVVDVDDWVHLTVHLNNGSVGTIEASRVHYGQEESTLTVVCEKGTIGLDLDKPNDIRISTLYPAQTTDVASVLQRYQIPAKYSTDGFLQSHAASLLTFFDRVRGIGVSYPVATFHDALAAERIVHAALGNER